MVDELMDLVELDRKGFILAPDVEPQDHIEAGRRTLEWAEAIHANLGDAGETELMGARFTDEQRLPDEIMEECLASARETYHINPDWVPAFYTNEFLPWYVGGASFYGADEDTFKVCFMLRNSFRDRSRWLIYNRDEIASHEACHVARAGFGQNRFEEPLAYAISPSRLRRNLGGMFTGNWEALTLLSSSLLLIAGSVIDMLGAPSWIRWISAIPLAASGIGLSTRATITSRQLNRARQTLEKKFGDAASAVLFRSTDEEVRELATLSKKPGSLEDWLSCRAESTRWDIIQQRFKTP